MSTSVLAIYGWDAGWAQAFEPYSDMACAPGRVSAEQAHSYRLHTATGDVWAEVPGRVAHGMASTGDFPAVGDWVAFRQAPGDHRALIEAVLPRRSRFSRKAAGSRPDEQVVASNVDVVLLVSSAVHDFHPRRVERYLALAWESGARPVVVISKADLHPDIGVVVSQAQAVASGVPVVPVSCMTQDGLMGLMPYARPGHTLALLGSSGIGKSTIVNGLMGREAQRVNEVRQGDGRGRHTTTHRELFLVPGGAMVIDTPGMREIQLWDAGVGLGIAFSDVEELAQGCFFRDCKHVKEPRCAVKAAMDEGTLDPARFRSYLLLQKEQACMERERMVRNGARRGPTR